MREPRCRSTNGLMLAGLIVATIGLVLMIGNTWTLPRYWQPVAVGVILFVVGALRAWRGGERAERGGER